MTSHNAIFSAAELEFIKARASTMARKEIHAAFVAKFKRADITLEQIHGLCSRRRWRIGRPKTCIRMRKSSLRRGSLMVATDTPDDYRQMQRVMWEELVGPIPKGHYLISVNGDNFDFDPFNWIMLTNSMMVSLVRHSNISIVPPELRRTIFATARLKQTFRDRTGKKFR